MLMKVFRHGVGRGSSVINYVMDAKDAKRQHSPPEVLRGDPGQVKQLIDSTGRKWKYTSGVLSWAPEDKVTLEQERELMDSFESHAFAGMEPDQYSILWVRHSHAGRHEMHFVIPRTELRTDKALNPCPPGWDKQYNPLCELWNRRNNWARPDEAKRARLVSPGVAIESYRSGTAAEIRKAVTDAILQGVEAGAINNRSDMVSELEGIGFLVPRKGRDYITIEIPTDNSTKKKPQRIRLKGALYAESWNAAEQRFGLGEQTQSPNGRANARDTADNARRVEQLKRRVAEIREARAEYNRKRFGRRSQAKQLIAERDISKPTPNLKIAGRHSYTRNSDGLYRANKPDIPLVPIRERQAGRPATKKRQTTSPSRQFERLADYNEQSGRDKISYVPQGDKANNTKNNGRISRSNIGGLKHVRTQERNFEHTFNGNRSTGAALRVDATTGGKSRGIGKRLNNGQAASERFGRKLERSCSNLRKTILRFQQFAEKQLQKERAVRNKRGATLGL